jgi:type IV pilus assembly protein PilA
MYAAPQQPPPQKKKGMSTGCIVALVLAGLSIPVLGVFAALAIYGMRRYLAASKTSEAKNTVGAISRGAEAAYERSLSNEGTGRLCESEGPDAAGHGAVPRRVPAGKKYQPSNSDWNVGSARGGWRCLKFAMTQPHYYQYHYNKGGNFQTDNPELDDVPESFEAAAIGDLDADGKTSAFSRVGHVDSSGKLDVSTQIFIEDEFE